MTTTTTDPQLRKAVGLPPLRSTSRVPVLAVVGVALLAVGAFVAGRDLAPGSGGSDPVPAVGTLYAAEAIPAGTPAAALGDAVEVRPGLPSGGEAGDALTTESPLDGLVVTADIPAGSAIRRTDLRSMTARERAISIPVGTEAVAVTLPFTPAGGAYVGPGDHVNVYAVAADAPGGAAGAQLLLADVRVLDVSVEVAPYAGATSGGTAVAPRPRAGDVTMLLAVPGEEVGRLVQATQSATLHVSLLDAEEGA